jgi:hypothetical protein
VQFGQSHMATAVNMALEAPSRPTSIYYVDDDMRAKDLLVSVPQGSAFAFFTTWNAVTAVCVTVIALLTIPWMRQFRTTRRIAAFTVVPLIIAAMSSIVCTTIVSQMMLAFNIKIERRPDSILAGRKLALGVEFVQKMLAYNFVAHLFPLVFVVVLGLALAYMPAPSTLLGRSSVFLMSVLYFAIFVVCWLLTPVKIQHSEELQSEVVTGWKKIKYVYRSPPMYYFTVVFPVVAIIVFVLACYALYGGMNNANLRDV